MASSAGDGPAIRSNEFAKIFEHTDCEKFRKIAITYMGFETDEINTLMSGKHDFDAKMEVCNTWYNKNSILGTADEIRKRLYECLCSARNHGLIKHESFKFLRDQTGE